MKTMIYVLGLLFMSSTAYAQSIDYKPAPVQSIDNGQIITHQIIQYTQFALSYNEKHEQPDWVAYVLTKDEANAPGVRQGSFKTDPNVTTGSSNNKDYTGSGFARGHMSPAKDNSFSVDANKESFYYSNSSPQLGKFNSDIWEDLESWVRKQAIEYDSVYVATGPVFKNNLGAIGSNQVTVPGYYYKMIMRHDGSKYRTIAFLIPHLTPSTEDFMDYIVPVNAIESITGIDFFPGIPDREETTAENSITKKYFTAQ